MKKFDSKIEFKIQNGILQAVWALEETGLTMKDLESLRISYKYIEVDMAHRVIIENKDGVLYDEAFVV